MPFFDDAELGGSMPDKGAPQTYSGPMMFNSGITGAGGYAPSAGPGMIMNSAGPGGAPGDDPFAYSNGSLLTPWTKQFQPPPGSSGGYSAPAYSPFNFGDFNYSGFRDPGGYQAGTIAGANPYTAKTIDASTMAVPDAYKAGTITGAPAFVAPTQAEAENDPGYQFARAQGEKAMTNKFAAAGLRGAGTPQALADYNRAAASDQYDKVYGRRFGEQENAFGQGFQVQSANEANRAQAYGLTNQYQGAANQFNAGQTQQAAFQNEANRFGAFNANSDDAFRVAQANEQNRLGAYTAASNTALGAGRLGFDIASGSWDRNYAKARQGYEDQQSAANAAASAGAANANQEYNRALQQYQMEHDIFQENQGNQFNRLMAMANIGNPGIVSPMQYAGSQGDIYLQRGNAGAAGQVGSGNAWQQAFGGMANAGLGAAGAYAGWHPQWSGG